MLFLAATARASKQVPLFQVYAAGLWEPGVAAYNAEDWDEVIRCSDRFVLTGGSDPRVV